MFGALIGGIAKGVLGKGMLGGLLNGGLGKLLGGGGFLKELVGLGKDGKLTKEGLEGKIGEKRTKGIEKALKAGKDKEVIKALKKQGVQNPEQVVAKIKEALGMAAPQKAAGPAKGPAQAGAQAGAACGHAKGGAGGAQGQMGQLIQVLKQLLDMLQGGRVQGGPQGGAAKAAGPQGAAPQAGGQNTNPLAQMAQKIAGANDPREVLRATHQLNGAVMRGAGGGRDVVNMVNKLAEQKLGLLKGAANALPIPGLPFAA